MEREGTPNRRLGLLVAVASASVTLAIGLTLGALLGYVHAPQQLEPLETGAASAPLADSTPPDRMPPVVLVPVQPAPPAARGIRAAATHTRLASAGTRPRAVHHEDDDED